MPDNARDDAEPEEAAAPESQRLTPAEQPLSAQGQSRQGSRAGDEDALIEEEDERRRLKRKRLPKVCFAESQLRLENALKYTPAWLEAFMIYALVWTFHSVLGPAGRQRLDSSLRAKYEAARSDFAAYQREKKRRLAEKTKLLERGRQDFGGRAGQEKRPGGRRGSTLSSPTPGAGSSEPPSAHAATPVRTGASRGAALTPTWTDELPEPPLLISELPGDQSVFDVWYSVDSSQWQPFSLELAQAEAEIAFSERPESQRKMQNLFVPSMQSVRQELLLECLVTNFTSTLVLGQASSGRSSLLRSTLFSKVFEYTKQLVVEHLPMSKTCDATLFKNKIESVLELKAEGEGQTPKLRPYEGCRMICYIEDLHLGFADAHGDQPAIEALRDYLTAGAWLSPNKARWRELEGVALFACMPTNAPESSVVCRRALHLFAIVT